MVMTRSMSRKRKRVEKPKVQQGKKKNKIEEEEEEEYDRIEEGDMVNLSDLLFTKRRDYLIKYKDNQRVKAEQLVGKFIVLHIVSLADHKHWRSVTEELVDIYNVMQPKGEFEVVFVAVRDAMARRPSFEREISTPWKRFEERFSTMPWTAIPFSDVKSRKRLEKLFGLQNGVDYDPRSFVFDPTGVLLCSAVHLLEKYGAAAYSFTKERIEFVHSEDNEAIMQLSKKSLLTSSERDFLITNNRDHVPVHNLEDKVVGLLFFDQVGGLSYLVEKLRMAYEQFKGNFEVVLIYVTGIFASGNPGDEESFWDVFKTMPWLALPFKDTNCKKLMRIFGYPHPLDVEEPIPSLVIIGPHGKFVEPYADDILVNYGTAAYPFTRSSAINLIVENARKAKLETFWEPDAIFRQNNGSQVHFSQLIGKRIIVLFDSSIFGFDKFVSKLKIKYIQMKNTDNEFEVIHICIWSTKFFSAPLPWLMHPPFDKGSDADKLLNSIFRDDGLIAFDVDGTVVRRTHAPSLQDDTVFPFYGGGLEAEISWLFPTCEIETSREMRNRLAVWQNESRR